MDNIKISILCPTAKRPNELKRMVYSALKLAEFPQNLEFCLYIDRGDKSYNSFVKNFPSKNLKVLIGPKMWLSGMYNSLLALATGDLLMWGGDDVVFMTEGWDRKIAKNFEAFEDPWRMMFVNDLTHGSGTWANIGFVHKQWVDLYGYLFTPHMPDNGIDAWITSITKKLNRAHYIDDVVIEHRQYRQGKASIDSTYQQRLQKHKTYNPLMLYQALDQEKRRDLIILSTKSKVNFIPFDIKYCLSYIFLKLFAVSKSRKITDEILIYIGSMNNISFIKLILRKIGIPVGPSDWY